MAYENDIADPGEDESRSDESKSDWADVHKEALEDFEACREADQHNREAGLEDMEFARLGKQWPEDVVMQRQAERRPCMTFNRLPTFIRSVVNDARQNKPAIKVHPADDQADPQTANVINDLIRNIEYSSNAEVAYDVGIDCGVSCGFGYWRVDMEYAHDDSFDMDLVIEPIHNPFAVYGDYEACSSDSLKWNRAFVVELMDKDAFKDKYKNGESVDWDGDAWKGVRDTWCHDDKIMVAEYWRRREVKETIWLLSDGRVVRESWLDEQVPDLPNVTNRDLLAGQGITPTQSRETTTHKVTQYIVNGVEVLKQIDWKGRFIPIVMVAGEEVNIEGKRYLRSLFRDAKDAQRNFNYWRTTTTELVALAPKAPWLGKVGQFDTDADKWQTANTEAHAYIEYDDVDGAGPPQRQPFAGVPAGALQEALNASDDMKSTIGIYDPSLGARSNETSGVAINARKTQASNNTFHFIDNQARAIRATGRILIDLIPHVYSKARVVRVMGEDKKPRNVQINQPMQQPDGTQAIYDLTAGKYDLTVDVGPGYQTKREEAAYGMTELVRAFPPSAAVIAPHLAKTQDWPGADEIAQQLAALAPQTGGPTPQVQQMQQQLQQAGNAVQQLQQALNDKSSDRKLEERKLDIDAAKAESDRLKALASMGLTLAPEVAAQLGFVAAQQAIQSPDLLPGGAMPPQPVQPAPPDQGEAQPPQAIQ